MKLVLSERDGLHFKTVNFGFKKNPGRRWPWPAFRGSFAFETKRQPVDTWPKSPSSCSSAAARVHMKKCDWCGQEYPDSTEQCTVDGRALALPAEQHSTPA